jgi:hypothetical protein
MLHYFDHQLVQFADNSPRLFQGESIKRISIAPIDPELGRIHHVKAAVKTPSVPICGQHFSLEFPEKPLLMPSLVCQIDPENVPKIVQCHDKKG